MEREWDGDENETIQCERASSECVSFLTIIFFSANDHLDCPIDMTPPSSELQLSMLWLQEQLQISWTTMSTVKGFLHPCSTRMTGCYNSWARLIFSLPHCHIRFQHLHCPIFSTDFVSILSLDFPHHCAWQTITIYINSCWSSVQIVQSTVQEVHLGLDRSYQGSCWTQDQR